MGGRRGRASLCPNPPRIRGARPRSLPRSLPGRRVGHRHHRCRLPAPGRQTSPRVSHQASHVTPGRASSGGQTRPRQAGPQAHRLSQRPAASSPAIPGHCIRPSRTSGRRVPRRRVRGRLIHSHHRIRIRGRATRRMRSRETPRRAATSGRWTSGPRFRTRARDSSRSCRHPAPLRRRVAEMRRRSGDLRRKAPAGSSQRAIQHLQYTGYIIPRPIERLAGACPFRQCVKRPPRGTMLGRIPGNMDIP